MKNASESAGKFAALMKRLGPPAPTDLPASTDAIGVLVESFLLWESTTAKAREAYQKLQEAFVDFNELRVSLPYEIALAMGQNDPKGLDRCQRLRAVLNDIFKREHSVSVKRVVELGRRDARKYLDSLEGMVPYVAARVALLSFDAHAVPVDDRLRALLIEEGVGDESVEIAELSPWLVRQVKASEARDTHLVLQRFSDEADARLAASAARARKRKAAKGRAIRKSGRAGASSTKKKKPTTKTRRAKKA